MKLYYEDDYVQLFHGNSIESSSEIPHYDLVITDPPYGINLKTYGNPKPTTEISSRVSAKRRDFPKVFGDDKAFDPTIWIDRPSCLWGANYFSDKLPIGTGWLIWDKKRPKNMDQSEVELAWTNFINGQRIFGMLWNGCITASNEERVHPTQKPVALFKWILSLKWTPEGIILDPFAGSGPCLKAAKQLGRKAIGIEIHEPYCEHIAKSLEQETVSMFSISNEEEYPVNTMFRLDCGKK